MDNLYPQRCPACGTTGAINGEGELVCANCGQYGGQVAPGAPLYITADDPRVYVPPAIRIRTTLRKRGWNEDEIAEFLALVREFGRWLGDE